jgi:hypothetical protein
VTHLVDPSCAGYAAAYQTQHCPHYSDAYDDFQCDLNPQYGPFCRGYTQEDSVAYFDEEQVDYGFNEEDMWYDEEYDEWLDPNDPCYQNNCEGFTDADWYALDTLNSLDKSKSMNGLALIYSLMMMEWLTLKQPK